MPTTSFIGVYAKTYGSYAQGGVVKPKLTRPANLRVVGTPTADTIVWAWDAVPHADGYVLREGSQAIYTGPALTFTQTGLAPGTGHSVTVGATDSTNAYQASPYSASVTGSTAGAGLPVMETFGVAGQSNSLEKGLTSDADNAPLTAYPTLKQAQTNLEVFNPNSNAHEPVQIGVNDLSASDPTDCGTTGPGGGTPYPPARGIALGGLALRLKELFPTQKFRVIKFSANGQSFQSILTDGAWKSAHDARFAAAIAATQAQGYTYHLKAVKIQFGETDFAQGNPFGPLADQYVSEMTANGFAQADTLWVVVGVKDSDGIDKSSYRTQMLAWVNADTTRRRYINPVDFQGIVNDNLHLNGVTQMQIGHSDFPNQVFGTTGGFRITSPGAPNFVSFDNYRQPGEQLELRGSRFTSSNGATPIVKFGSLNVPVVSFTDTSIIVVAPSIADPCVISIQTTGGTSNSTITFTPAVLRPGSAEEEDSFYFRFFPLAAWQVGQQGNYSAGFAKFLGPGQDGYCDVYFSGTTLAGDLPEFSSLGQQFDYQIDNGPRVTVSVPLNPNAGNGISSSQKWITSSQPAGIKRLRIYAVGAYNLYCIVDRIRCS